MSGLSYICEYDDEEGSLSDENDYEHHKKEDCPKPKFPRPNLSAISVVSFDEHVDNSDLHGGRVRTFPHVRGDWATYVYIEYPDKENLFKVIDKLSTLLATIDASCCKCEDIHISLSKTFVLKYHMISTFTTSLQELLNNVESCQDNDTITVIAVNNSVEEAGAEDAFFDAEGRFYYHPSLASINVSLVTESNQNNEQTAESHILVSEEDYQTVTLIPSNSGNGKIGYMLFTQDDTKPVMNIDIKFDERSSVLHKFEENKIAKISSKETDNNAQNKTGSSKKLNYLCPEFTCDFCSYTSSKRYLVLRHMKRHSEERPHKCNVCERGFKTSRSLQIHVNMHNGVKPHVCKYCNVSFTSSGELVRHIRYRHTHEKPHKCTECDYASVELSKLKRHVRCHTGERPYQCPHCTYASQDTFKLKRHMRTHTGEKPYKCEYCNISFTQSNSLKVHKLIHNVSEKPVFPCELCPRLCGRKIDLRLHVQKLHTSDKLIICNRCGKSFPDRYTCKIHNKTHNGEKFFKCRQCPYASTALSRLKSHMLKHTDEKTFVCDQCDRSFKRKQLLRGHLNLCHNSNNELIIAHKEKTHTCHECKRTFAHRGNLIRHLNIHDPESIRQRKLTFVDGIETDNSKNHTEEIVRLELEGNQVECGQSMTVPDSVEQQYVALEIVQSTTITIPTNDFMVQTEEIDDRPIDRQVNTKKLDRTLKHQNDIDICFGFDEEELVNNYED